MHYKGFSNVIVEKNQQIARLVAKEISDVIRKNNAHGSPTVLGLATGNTPVFIYQELVRLYKEEGLDFSQVVTFNLDEYYPIDPRSPQSFRSFMQEKLFDHVNIHPEHIHIPDGSLPGEQIKTYCDEYENKIREAGGIHFFILGIGQNGHIGFNEPGSDEFTRTRLVQLDQITRKNAASTFGGEEHVPHQAITMGVASILEAQKIVLIAAGTSKAHIIQQTISSPISASIPATYLKNHDNAAIYLDPEAASLLDLSEILALKQSR